LSGLVVYAVREEARRVGDDLRFPLGTNSKMPPGVQRDFAKFLAKNRGAENVNESTFADTARSVWGKQGLNADQLRTDIFAHLDTPSLFVHCCPLVTEDIFDISNDAVWSIREVSRMANRTRGYWRWALIDAIRAVCRSAFQVRNRASRSRPDGMGEGVGPARGGRSRTSNAFLNR